MKKVLLIAAKANMIKQFNMRNIKLLINEGFNVHVATDFLEFGSMDNHEANLLKAELENMGVVSHQVDFKRGVGSIAANVLTIKQIMEILSSSDEWEFVHAHSPIGGVLGRIAAKLKGVKSIYTAHGFHFSTKGAIKNWLVFPVEYLLSFMTDHLILINEGDYVLANRLFKSKNITYIPSVGANVSESLAVSNDEKKACRANIRRKLQFSGNDFVFLSVGELNRNKNHEIIIRAMQNMPSNVRLVIAGVGERHSEYLDLVDKLNLKDKVKLVGYQHDLTQIHYAADAFLFPSFREGLGMSGLDALLDGLYIIGSNSTNMSDFIINNELGMLISPKRVEEWEGAMLNVLKHNKTPNLKEHEESLLAFDKERVDNIMAGVYASYARGN